MQGRIDGDGRRHPHECRGPFVDDRRRNRAAVHGDRDAAYQALLAHPIGPKADKVQKVLDDMLETHREHLPQFFK